MAENSRVWEGISVGDAIEAPYTDTEWSYFWELLQGVGASYPNYGVLRGTGGGVHEPLDVRQTGSPSTNILVDIGSALVNGRIYETTATVTLAIAANASGNARIDTVVLRVDYTAQTVRLVVLQGTPAASPVCPTLTQNTSTYEMPLADIAVANGFSSISSTNITPRQRPVDGTKLGWQAFAYPVGYIPNGSYDAASVSISSSGVLALPVLLTGNMLVNSITFRKNNTVNDITVEWGLYTQDVNDANTAENTLRQICYGTALVAAAVGSSNVTIPVTRSIPQIIGAGAYWLVIKTNAVSLPLGAVTASGFQAGVNSYRIKNSSTDINNATFNLDFVSGWSGGTEIIAARLNGRVFGQTAIF